MSDTKELDALAEQVKAEMKKMEEAAKKPCEKEVSIFPTRYTVTEPILIVPTTTSGYKPLKNLKYVLEVLREGYVYVYDASKGDIEGLRVWRVIEEGDKFEELKQLDLAKKTYTLEGAIDHISVSAKSTEAYVGFLDILWTESMFNQIVKDSALRDKFMTKIEVKKWDKNEPTDHTFNMSKLNLLVRKYLLKELKEFTNTAVNDLETFASTLIKSYYGIPKAETQSPSKAEKKANVMGASPRTECREEDASEKKIMGVSLFDNIGLILDCNDLIEKNEYELCKYLEENLHKRMVAEAVEEIYVRELDSFTSKVHTAKDWESYYEKYMGKRYIDTHTIQQYDETRRKLKKEFFKINTKNKESHVKEEERLAYIEEYTERIKFLEKRIHKTIESRRIHLENLTEIEKETDLGSSFLAYDKEDLPSQIMKADLTDRCIKKMFLPLDQELFSTWLNMEEENPILETLNAGFIYKADSYEAIIGAFGESAKKLADDYDKQVTIDKEKNLSEQKSNEKTTQASKAEHSDAKKAKPKVSNKIDSLRSALAKEYGRSFNTIENLLFTVGKNKVLLDATSAQSLDDLFAKALGIKSKSNATAFFSVLSGEHESMKGTFKNNIHVVTLSSEQFDTHFRKSLPTELKDIALSKNTNLQGGVQVLMYLKDEELAEFEKQIEKKRALGQTISSSQKNIAKAVLVKDRLIIEAMELDNKHANPFVTDIDKNVLAPIVLIFNMVNVYQAHKAFSSDEKPDPMFKEQFPEMQKNIDTWNIRAAYLGATGAVLYAHDVYRSKGLAFGIKEFTIKSKKMKVPIIKVLPSNIASYGKFSPLFGFMAATADFWTQKARANKAYKEGNIEAGRAYMTASIFLGTGGIMVSWFFVMPILFMVGGLIILMGVLAMARGDRLNWDDLDKWLNVCSFGKHNPLVSLPFSSQKEEYTMFLQLCYQPKFNIEWEEVYASLPFKSRGVYGLKLKVTFPYAIKENFKWGLLFTDSLKSVTERMYPKIAKRATLKSEVLLKHKLLHLQDKPVECEANVSYPQDNVFVLEILKTPSTVHTLNISFAWDMPTANENYVLKNTYQLERDTIKPLLLSHFKNTKEE